MTTRKGTDSTQPQNIACSAEPHVPCKSTAISTDPKPATSDPDSSFNGLPSSAKCLIASKTYHHDNPKADSTEDRPKRVGWRNSGFLLCVTCKSNRSTSRQNGNGSAPIARRNRILAAKIPRYVRRLFTKTVDSESLSSNVDAIVSHRVSRPDNGCTLGQATHSNVPFLEKRHSMDGGKKCLIIDLDETLVHSSFKPIYRPDFSVEVEIDGQGHQVYVLMRPHVSEFLEAMGQLYECVLFTASLSKYADPVVDRIDTKRVFRARLFRDSCVFLNGNYVKDLKLLGRPLDQIVILDNAAASFHFQPTHAIQITSWFNDRNDRALLDLIPYFEQLAKHPDVPSFLQNNSPPCLSAAVGTKGLACDAAFHMATISQSDAGTRETVASVIASVTKDESPRTSVSQRPLATPLAATSAVKETTGEAHTINVEANVMQRTDKLVSITNPQTRANEKLHVVTNVSTRCYSTNRPPRLSISEANQLRRDRFFNRTKR